MAEISQNYGVYR